MKLIKECVLPDKFENCSAWLGVKLDTKIGLYTNHHPPPTPETFVPVISLNKAFSINHIFITIVYNTQSQVYLFSTTTTQVLQIFNSQSQPPNMPTIRAPIVIHIFRVS